MAQQKPLSEVEIFKFTFQYSWLHCWIYCGIFQIWNSNISFTHTELRWHWIIIQFRSLPVRKTHCSPLPAHTFREWNGKDNPSQSTQWKGCCPWRVSEMLWWQLRLSVFNGRLLVIFCAEATVRIIRSFSIDNICLIAKRRWTNSKMSIALLCWNRERGEVILARWNHSAQQRKMATVINSFSRKRTMIVIKTNKSEREKSDRDKGKL